MFYEIKKIENFCIYYYNIKNSIKKVIDLNI